MDQSELKQFNKEITKAKNHNKKLTDRYRTYLKKKEMSMEEMNEIISGIEYFYIAFLPAVILEEGISDVKRYINQFDKFDSPVSTKDQKKIIHEIFKFYTFLNEKGKISDSILKRLEAISKKFLS